MIEKYPMVDHMECPYCKKDIEVEIKGLNPHVDLRKLEHSIMTKEFAKRRKIEKELIKEKLDQKVDLLNKEIRKTINEDQELTIEEIKKMGKKLKIPETYMKHMIYLLKSWGEIYEPKKGIFKII